MKDILIIGGTGTLGTNLVPIILKESQARIRVMSRGEHTQMRMEKAIGSQRVTFFVGDVRDYERVDFAMRGCDAVFNFAAVKSVDKAEYDSLEAVKTNIDGAKNVVKAAIKNGVEKCMFTSTDKAVAPINLYGATKLVAEKLFINGNIGAHRTRFSCVRYGNVLSSQGSVIEVWASAYHSGKAINITEPGMTRFFMSPQTAASFVWRSFCEMKGGEIFIPKMRACTMGQLSAAFCELHEGFPNVLVVGLRPGEKIHECLICKDELAYVTELGDKFIKWPTHNWFTYLVHGNKVEKELTSEGAPEWKKEDLKALLKKLL